MSRVKSIAPDVVGAVAEFLATFAVPAVPASSIICGNQNNISLPPTNDYIIFHVLMTTRHGTTLEEWSDEEDTMRLTETAEVSVQVDCYADSRNGADPMVALRRAQAVEVVARSSTGPAFFSRYGISCLYADEPRDTTIGSSDSGQYLRRWTTTLHLSTRMGVEIDMGYFDAATVKVENVEVHHPPE